MPQNRLWQARRVDWAAPGGHGAARWWRTTWRRSTSRQRRSRSPSWEPIEAWNTLQDHARPLVGGLMISSSAVPGCTLGVRGGCPSGMVCRLSDAAFLARDGGSDPSTHRADATFSEIALPDAGLTIISAFKTMAARGGTGRGPRIRQFSSIAARDTMRDRFEVQIE
jgi:hypothetical protein